VKFKNRQEVLVALAVGAGVLWVGVNWVFTPLQDLWANRQVQIKNLREQVKDGNGMIHRDQAIRSHWSNMLSNALPANSSLAEQKFLTALDGWSHESGAVITSIMPQWKNEGSNYMTLTCRVETTGDLGSLSKFIYNIEKGPLMARLDTVELSSHDNNGQELTLGVEINALALLLQNNKK
jgi:Tfp pilus assembly protein PilO